MALTAHQAQVTGGTKGFARAVVGRLACERLSVVMLYRKDETTREDVAREFAETGFQDAFEKVDLDGGLT